MEGAMQQAAQWGRQFMERDYIRTSPDAAYIAPDNRHATNLSRSYRIHHVRNFDVQCQHP